MTIKEARLAAGLTQQSMSELLEIPTDEVYSFHWLSSSHIYYTPYIRICQLFLQTFSNFSEFDGQDSQ